MSLSSIGFGGLFRTGVTAMLDSMGSTFPKAAVATLEDSTRSKVDLARQCLIDEGPEVFWKTIVGSLFVKTMRSVAPGVPEQIANFPGEMLGALLHWWSASHDSIATQGQREADKKNGVAPGFGEEFFLTCVNKPLKFLLKTAGLDTEKDKNVSFWRFGLIQAGLLAGGAYVLRNAEEENIPGMNLDHEEPWYTSFFKTAGYTVFEQVAHTTSQTIRYYIENYKEFMGDRYVEGKKSFDKNVLAKALANVVNEKLIPGNIPSAISGCLSTLFLGRFMPKSLAGAIGEAPMKGLERLLTFHRRRATKDKYDENSSTKRVDNFRGHDTPWFRNILDTTDKIFNPLRESLVKNVVAKIFKPENITMDTYVKELTGSYNLSEELLKAKAEKHAKENKQKELREVT